MKTKTTKTKISFLFLLFLFSLNSFSQTPNWIWERNPDGVSYDGADATATDADGNVYVTGYFYGSSIDFGGYVLTNASGGNRNMFIVKYDASGTVLWAESAGGNSEDAGLSVAIDKSNNVCVTGYFLSPSITFGSITLINQGSYDMFVVKYNTLGTVLWAISAGRGFDDYGRSVTTDAWNNVYITGSFQSATILFGPTTLTNTDATESTYDMYIAKYDSTGTFLWAKSAAGDTSEYSRSISTDPLGNIYVTGSFNSTTLSFGSAALTNSGSYDMYLVKYDSAGNDIWASSVGGNKIERGNATATDSLGNVYVSGGFQSSAINIGGTPFINSGTFNMYLAKYDPSGTVLWAKTAGGTGADDGYDVATDIFGNAYVAGYFNSPSLTLGSTTLTNIGGADVFIVKYDNAGVVSWAKSAGDLDEEYGFAVSTYASDVYIAGRFRSSTMDFYNTLFNTGGDDAFLAKIGESGIGIIEENTSSDISIFPNPFNSQTTVLFSEIQKNSFIKIIDVLGKEVRTIKFNGKQLEIEKKELSNGIYFLQILDGNKTVNKKIIIQ